MKKNKEILEKILILFIIIICLMMAMFKVYSREFFGILLLGINGYMLWKYRKNRLLFFSMLIIMYFNYSFVITRYIGTTSSLLDSLYRQLYNEKTLYISIIMQIIFLCVINLIVGRVENVEIDKIENTLEKFRYRKIMIFIMQFVLILILIYHLLMGINYNTTIFEYSIYFFIFIFYYCKNDNKNKIITEIILIFFAIYSIKCGDRIAVLQFLLVDFIINYLNKFKIKNIIGFLLAGIILFTVAGLYGDFLDYRYDFKDLTMSLVINKFKERRLALDTSVSAYFSGISMIDVSNKYSNEERIKNGIDYFLKYTVIGSKANYITVDILIRQYQVNYGGGLPTCYFYFWYGWSGVFAISIYVGILFKKIKESTINVSSEYNELLSIFIISTIPRWYLYVPTLLFRGIIIFTMFYMIVKIIFIKKVK